MDQQDLIQNAEREAHRDRPKDSLSLICAVLLAQHRAIVELYGRLERAEKRLQHQDPW